jgi:23S rRNA (guanine745-N1)-methyltransferase
MSDTVWMCPVCGKSLSASDLSLVCETRHNFDRAKKGAVYLLPPNRKHSKIPGDDPEMVRARRDFLSKGYYAHLREAVIDALSPHLDGNRVLLDAGCGEGYYTAGIHAAFPSASVYGADISKTAANYAAKADPAGSYAVASVFHLPILDASCDAVVSIFAPYCGEEFLRVLKPGGIFVMAIPAAKHLWEMKTAVYDHPYENEVKDYALAGFTFLGKREAKREITLHCAEDIRSLFGMTPYAYRTGAKERERLQALTELTVHAEFEVLSYQKEAANGI